MLLCDIETPEELKPKFEEFCPFFKNTTVSRDDIGEHIREYAERNNVFKKPCRMLIGSYFGKEILLITHLVKSYLDHGLKVTKVYEFIEYYPSKCFEKFGLNVSEARRASDSDPSKAVLGETQKLHGNSSCRRCLTNKEKHRDVRYCNRSEVTKLINSRVFHRLNIITDDLYEVECLKKSVKEDLPLQISFFVYGYAKLRMLEYYFDFLLHFIDRQDFQCVQSDTDSLYMAFSGETLIDCVKPHNRREYFEDLHHWLPLDVCDQNRADYVETQCAGKPWSLQQCCTDQFKCDRRTPMLFKQEWAGSAIVALSRKTYFRLGEKHKHVSKGISIKQNQFTHQQYLDVLKTQRSRSDTNTTSRSTDNEIRTLAQQRCWLTYFYPKRIVLDDGVSTAPLLL